MQAANLAVVLGTPDMGLVRPVVMGSNWPEEQEECPGFCFRTVPVETAWCRVWWTYGVDVDGRVSDV